MMGVPARAVVTAQDQTRLAELTTWLEAAGYAVEPMVSGAAAIRYARAESPALFVLGDVDDLSEAETRRLLPQRSGQGPALVALQADTSRTDALALVRHSQRANDLEARLTSADRRFETALRGSTVAAALVGADLAYLQCNARWQSDVIGVDAPNRPGLTLLDHTAAVDQARLREAAAAAMAGGRPVSLLRASTRDDGTQVDTYTTLMPITGADAPQLVVECTASHRAADPAPLRAMLAASPLAACSLDAAGRVTATNPALLQLLQLTDEEMLGQPFADLLDSPDRLRFDQASILTRSAALEVTVRRARGRGLRVQLSTAPSGYGDGDDRALLLLSEAPSAEVAPAEHVARAYALTAIIRRLQQHNTEQALPDVMRVVASTVRAVAVALCAPDAAGNLVPLPGVLVGRTPELWPSTLDAGDEGEPFSRLELPVRWGTDAAASLVALRSGAEPFSSHEKRFLTEAASAIGTASARERLSRSQVRANTHDRLTDLPNREHLLNELDSQLRRSRGRTNPILALTLDIDHFHAVNDGLSYAIGDDLLCQVAERLRNAIPISDILARIGGDEFAIVARDPEDLEHAEAIGEEVATVLAQPFDVAGSEIRITASLGLALSRRGLESGEELLNQAHLAMGRAKRDGGARAHLFSDDMHRSTLSHLQLIRDLRGAIDHNEFEPWYQPVVDLASGKVVGVEALARWRHPLRGVIGPDEFIQVCEETGLINDVGQHILERSCHQVAEWRQGNASDLSLRFAVNVSGKQLARPDFAESVASALASAKADSRLLTIEVTESVLMDDPVACARTLQHLKDLGVSVSIDDFGTGFSSLSYLRQFAVDELKVDRRFVAGLGLGGAPEIATAIIRLAQALGLRVVAEGVETQDQLEALFDLGVTTAQGFIWSPPMPQDEFLEWLASTPSEGLSRAAGADRTSPVPRQPSPRRLEVDHVLLDVLRDLLRVQEASDATAVLTRLVGQLGGYTLPLRVAHGNGLPFDLSLGEGEPIVAVAEAGSVTAMLLAEVLPEVIDDATRAISNARQVVRLASDAALDPLTGLLNRRGLTRAYARLREGDIVAVIDIDHFKQINDSFGHAMGDEVLQAFGRMLRDEGRAADYIGRMGGDEFVVLLLRCQVERALHVLDRLREAWSGLQPVPVTFTAGIAVVGADHSTEAAFERADIALYDAKQRGRNTAQVFGRDPSTADQA